MIASIVAHLRVHLHRRENEVLQAVREKSRADELIHGKLI